MSRRSVELLFSDHKRNCIPAGRQLPRTPPPRHDCVRQLAFPSEGLRSPAEVHTEESQDPNTTFDHRTPPVRPDPSDDPQSMVKGMKGYQLTPADLDFMQKLKEEKELKKVQDDLKTAQNVLKKETMALELALASVDQARAELRLLPACEDLRRWSVLVLEMSAPSVDLSELDTKALLALVTPQAAKKAVQEKKAQLKQLEKMVEKKKKNDAKERGLLEKQTATEQSKLLSLMGKLSELKSALVQQEEVNKSLKTQQAEKVEEKSAPRRGKAKQKSEKADPTSKPSRQTNQQQKSEPDAPVDPASTPSGSRAKGRRNVAADPGEKGPKETRPGAPTRSRRKAPVSAPAEEPDLGLRRSKRIACRK